MISPESPQATSLELSQAKKQPEQKGEQIRNMQKSEQIISIDYQLKEVIDYFSNKDEFEIKNLDISKRLTDETQISIKNQIQGGITFISEVSKELQLHHQIPQVGEESKLKKVEYTAPVEHKSFIQRMNKARKISQKRRKMNIQYDQKKQERFLKQQEELRIKSDEKIKEDRQNQIKQRLKKLQMRKEKMKQQQIQSLKRYKSVISEKQRHNIMIEKYQNQMLLPLLEEEKKKIQERKNKMKGYSIDEIRQFEKEYAKRQRGKESRRKELVNNDYHPPPINPRLHQIIEEEKIKERMKLEQKKRSLQQKISRQKSYVQYLKESICVKIDENKKKQIEVKKASKIIPQKSNEQMRSIGDSYLKQLRGKIKRKQNNFSFESEPVSQKTVSSNKAKSNSSIGHYNRSLNKTKQQRLNQLISSRSLNKHEKLEKLKHEVQILNQESRRKNQLNLANNQGTSKNDQLQLLLCNIRVKVGMINLYQN